MDFGQLAAYLNYALTWIGFGTVLGMVALIVVPGKDGGGALATVLMAIAGTMIGCAILQFFNYNDVGLLPMSMQGFTVGAGGAIVLLMFYKVLGGAWLLEHEQNFFRHPRRRRRRFTTEIED